MSDLSKVVNNDVNKLESEEQLKSDSEDEGQTRRDFVVMSAIAVGCAGAAAAAVPFIRSMSPDAGVLAVGSTEVDVSHMISGEIITVMWRGSPVFIFRRTPSDVEKAREVDISTLRDPELDQDRVKKGKDEWLIAVGICTHLGCVPIGHKGGFGGWFCPCHGSEYDTSGRIRKGPAPKNLAIPPYDFITDTKIKIG